MFDMKSRYDMIWLELLSVLFFFIGHHYNPNHRVLTDLITILII
jgi:hypothetical protein